MSPTGGTSGDHGSGTTDGSSMSATSTSMGIVATSEDASTTGSASADDASSNDDQGEATSVGSEGGDVADTSGTPEEGSSSSGEPPLGPQIVRSSPSDGARSASLQPSFYLYFDRIISPHDATGHLFVAQGDGDPAPVSPLACPPDNDPTCIAAVYPASFREGERLPGNTRHRIIVDRDFPDLDGVTNSEDQVVEFTTLDFTSNVFDDSGVLRELGGMAYDPGTESLFLYGSTNERTCVVRRVAMRDSVLGSATTVATPLPLEAGQDVCNGASVYDGAFYAALTYEGRVVRYRDLHLDDWSNAATVFGPSTSLEAPHDTLDLVWSIAAYEDRVLFSFGKFLNAQTAYAILETTAGRTYTIFNDGDNLWSTEDEVVIAIGTLREEPYLFAFDGDELYKFRLGDGTLVDTQEIGQRYAQQIHVDAYGHLYLGHSDGIAIYDANDFESLGAWNGFQASRFAVIASEASAEVYVARDRAPAVLGRLRIEF